MDLATGAATIAGAIVAKGYLDALLKAPLEQFGAILSDRVALWRLANQTKIVLDAKAICEKRRVKLAPTVFPSVVVPIVEEGGTADGPELIEMFAELLAAHLDADRQREVHPSFAKVMGELSSQDARVLAIVDTMRKERLAYSHLGGRSIAEAICGEYADRPEVELSLANLERLGICRYDGLDVMPHADSHEKTARGWYVTQYGHGFLIACHEPSYWRRGTKPELLHIGTRRTSVSAPLHVVR